MTPSPPPQGATVVSRWMCTGSGPSSISRPKRRTATSASPTGYLFRISDTGIGIAMEDIPKALSRFGQVQSGLDRSHEGTGLGLPLTKALVEKHGGSLDLQSKPGTGTTVTVRLPAERIVNSVEGTRTAA